MSDATAAMARISVELQRLTDGYKQTAIDAATNEATYRQARAKAKLRAIVGGASAAKADAMADADDDVAQACLDYKTSSAVADAWKQKLMQLRGEYDGQRDLLRRETTSDRAHGQVGV